MQAPETRYAVRPDGVSIAYQVFGEGPTRPPRFPRTGVPPGSRVVRPRFGRLWRRLASFARVIVYDKPGTGLSDPIMHVPTLEERRDDIRIVLDEVGSERTALLGFSEGGPDVRAVRGDRSRAGRVAGPLWRVRRARDPGEEVLDGPDRIAAYERCRRAPDLEANWGQGKTLDYFAPSVASRLERSGFATFERAAASPALARRLIEASRRIDVRGVLGAVGCPPSSCTTPRTSFPVFHARLLANGIPGAVLKVLPGRDHIFWVSDFEESVSEIERFLTGSVGAASSERALATILFTDIVGSTERASELGDSAWRQLLERHDRVVRERVAEERGRVVKSLGDGTLAVFDGPARAIRAAEAIRDGLSDLEIQVRAGVHTGECELISEDVGGLAVHIGARVGGMADAGEILVSSTVADLVVGSGMSFIERGEHELKGVPGRWRLLAVGDPAARPEPLQAAAVERDITPSDRVTLGLARRAPGPMRAMAELGRRAGRRRTEGSRR